MSQTSSSNDKSGSRTGSVKAGGSIRAENIVTGAQILGADAEAARAMLDLAKDIESGSVEAVQDIIAKNLITGFQYIGQGGVEPNREQFQQESDLDLKCLGCERLSPFALHRRCNL